MRWNELTGQLWQSHRSSLILLSLLLILNLLLYLALVQFVTPRIAEQESTFLKRQTEVRQLLRNQGGATNNPEQVYLAAIQDLAKFRQSIPDYREFTGLIEELLVLSGRARLNITQIGYSSTQLEESALLKFELDFNVAGDYDQIKRFIYSLEQSNRLIAIKQIDLQSADGEGVKLRLKLETYFSPGGRDT